MKHRFEALDGLRGILALAVALHHFPVYSHFFLSPNVQTAGIAVDFFFVLSGFVITHASLAELVSWNAGIIFAIRRFGRLWPLHATMLLALVVLELVKLVFTRETGMTGRLMAFAPDSEKSIGSVLTNLFMLHGLGVEHRWTWNAPSWSISAEFFAYLLFAWIAIVARQNTTRIVAALALASGVFFFLIGPDVDTTYQYGFPRCICGFFIGHLVYRAWRASSIKMLAGASLWEMASVVLMLTFPLLPAFQNFSIMIPAAFALPVWVFAHQQGFVSRILTSRLIQYLGLLSYSIYLDHQLVIDIIKRGLFVIERLVHTQISFRGAGSTGVEGDFFRISNAWVGDAITIGFILAVITLAGLTYRFVENPGRRYFNALAGRLHARLPATPEKSNTSWSYSEK